MPESLVTPGFFTFPLQSRVSTMITFGVHFVCCLIVLIVGGLIADGAITRGTFAAADAFRYLGYILSLLLCIVFFIILIILRGGLCWTIFWFVEFPCFVFQTLAWIFDAVDANKLSGTGSDSYGLAVASAILGVIFSLFTLYIAIGLVFTHRPLSELCGGYKDCCGVQDQMAEANANTKHNNATTNNDHVKNKNVGKEEV